MMTKVNPSTQENKKPGSPDQGGPAFLTIGKLQRTHGVKGEIIMQVMTDFPERIVKGKKVYIGPRFEEYVIHSVRPNNQTLLLSFEGLNDCDQVSILRNLQVAIKTVDAGQLPEGEYYHHELIGMQVFESNGNLLGKIDEILVTGANDVYVIRQPDGKEILLPAIKEVILQVDRGSGRMTVNQQVWE